MILAELGEGRFYFQPQQQIIKANGDKVNVWSSRDSLVLKMLSLYLIPKLPNSLLCTHLKGHGGAKLTVNHVHSASQRYPFVFRTDVKSYYESIHHTLLLEKFRQYIDEKLILNLFSQYLTRSVDIGGNFRTYSKGISSGCPLSPLVASFYLYELDKAFEGKRVFYRRYMDDIIVLAKSRWQLRRAIRCINQHFAKLKVKQHPDKTFVGYTAKGFDFLGYQFNRDALSVAKGTLEKHYCRLSRLYEQRKSHPNWMTYLEDYRQHWFCWVKAGLNATLQDGLKINDDVLHLNPIMPVQTSR